MQPQTLKPALFTIAADTGEFLAELAQAATDQLGRTISMSAVLRAIVRAAQTAEPGFRQAIVHAVEDELNSGLRWGKTAANQADTAARFAEALKIASTRRTWCARKRN